MRRTQLHLPHPLLDICQDLLIVLGVNPTLFEFPHEEVVVDAFDLLRVGDLHHPA